MYALCANAYTGHAQPHHAHRDEAVVLSIRIGTVGARGLSGGSKGNVRTSPTQHAPGSAASQGPYGQHPRRA